MGEEFSNENRWIKVRGTSGLVYAINLGKVIYVRETNNKEFRNNGARTVIEFENGQLYTEETIDEIGAMIR